MESGQGGATRRPRTCCHGGARPTLCPRGCCQRQNPLHRQWHRPKRVPAPPFVAALNARTGLPPLKIRDYAAAGRATVATAIKGIAAAPDASWLLLAEPGNADAFARAIHRGLIAEPAKLRAEARATAE